MKKKNKRKEHMKEKWTIVGIQGFHYTAEVEANSEEEALKLAENNHEDYEWEDTGYIDDWNYDTL